MNRPVVAAIPNYNMGKSLAQLLPRLERQDYSDIYVFDDHSSDDSREIVDALDTRAVFVPSGENKGAGATRNKIISSLSYSALIHFIDADTVLETPNVTDVINDVMPNQPVGFIGGLARNPSGLQNEFNYGPQQGLWSKIGAVVQMQLADAAEKGNYDHASRIQKRYTKLLSDWPNVLEEPVRRQVFWNIEQNLVIDSDVFQSIGGFDEKLREHEIQDIAIRLAKVGLKSYFDPSFSIQHTAIDVRNYNRIYRQVNDELYIARKHGLTNWLLPDGHLRPRLSSDEEF
jgi:N-acetylglucosaminyl-diphospho-decaprenol L-rhamnosyltransferase